MLHLLVRLGSDAYAIDTGRVEIVVPFARLKSLPAGLAGAAGILNYRGRAVPVLDLTYFLTGHLSRESLGTRIILARVDLPCGERLLGLLVEGAHSVEQFDPESFQPAGIRPDGKPWLGPVAERDNQLVQRIEIAALLPTDVLDSLLRDVESTLTA